MEPADGVDQLDDHCLVNYAGRTWSIHAMAGYRDVAVWSLDRDGIVVYARLNLSGVDWQNYVEEAVACLRIAFEENP